MHEMDHGLRSSEGFIKKKSSSGCLIIKKKPISSGGVGPVQRNVFMPIEERERRRNLAHSVSGSSEDSLEPVRRGILPRNDRFYNKSLMYGEGIVGNNRFGQNGEFEGERRRKFDDDEFDGNIRLHSKRMRNDDVQDRYGVTRDLDTNHSGYGMVKNQYRSFIHSSSADETQLPLRQKFRVPSDKPIRVQGKNGVLKVMVHKSKNADILRKYYDRPMEDIDRFDSRGSKSGTAVNSNISAGPSICSGLKHRENTNSSVRIGRSEPTLQNPLHKRAKPGDSETEGSDMFLKPELTSVVIRKKNMHTTHKSYDHQHQEFKRGSVLEIDINNNAPVPMMHSDCKNGISSSLKVQKSEIEVQNSLSKRVKAGDSETVNCDSLAKRDQKSEQVNSSSKGVKSEAKIQSAEKAVLVKSKETKVKRGTGTEKQLLREKIRHKLVTAGWNIDYRPRKNRDYLDAVYIHPAGTAYWSIIKAYEAFKKEMGEEDVPEELLNKLTRQTRKKMEKEMERKQREETKSNNVKDIAREDEDTENEDNEEKLNLPRKKNDKSAKQRAEKPSTETNSRMIQERNTQEIGRSTLLVRSSDKGLKSQTDGYVPYMGKRTVLSWLIDSGIVHESAEVHYMNQKKTKVMLKGWIARNGIHCGCCSKILTILKFEKHAGSKLRQPYQHIFLESGISLLQCQIEAWNKQDEAKRRGFNKLDIDGDDANDDACGLCGDGGNLICCDGCPSTFHQSCMGIEALPPGDWHCPNCTCKFCEKSSSRGNALLTCSMCERKYHESCGEEIDTLTAGFNRKSTSFCGKNCLEVFSQLQKLLEVKHELESGFSWSLIYRADIDTDSSQHGFPKKVECNSKLAVALSVIEECFLPMNDRRSGINLVHNVLYNRGSNYSRLNHSGFYTAILERRDEIIAAASIRIHGNQLAEMPFIGTRQIYRRQGMCRRLLSAIELALSSLKVLKLIIPAIGEHMQTWTGIFGFKPLEDSHKKEMRSLKMLVFPRTEMLQKRLKELSTTEEQPTAESGPKSILRRHYLAPDGKKSSDFDPSVRPNSNACGDASLKSPQITVHKTPAIDSGLRVTVSNADTSSNSSSDIPSESNLKVLSRDKGNSSEDGITETIHQANIEVVEPILDSSGDNLTNSAE